MAMLAEKRQKVRWVLNPRQTAWSQDSNKFGQKYMEKLGWKAGKGIGANLQGCTDHVKVSVRSDNRGVGFKGVPEDILPHQNNYSDLLTQLAASNPPAVTKADEGKSLELKSSQSRARVHYHKFTRSKDLSRYTENDLACILGKPAKPNKNSVEDTVQNEPNFIHGGNMNAYFNDKMKSTYKHFISECDANNIKEEEEDSLYVGFGFNQTIKDVPILCPASENCDNKKESIESVNISRKKHNMNDQRGDKLHNDSCSPSRDCTETVGIRPMTNGQELQESSRKLNRKRKKHGESVELPEDCVDQTDFSETIYPIDKEGKIDQKTLKRKRRKIDENVEVPGNESFFPPNDCTETAPVQPMENEQELNESNKKPKKKRKKKSQSVEVLEDEVILPLADCEIVGLQQMENNLELSEGSKKSDRKRKKHRQIVELTESECVNEEEVTIKINKSKKKKKQRKTIDDSVEVPEYVNSVPQTWSTETQLIKTEEESTVNFKKSKKKRKNDHCMNVPESESCSSQTDFSEIVKLQLMENEKDSFVGQSMTSKKERKNILLCRNIIENDLESTPMNEETVDDISLCIKENVSSDHQPNNKKEKKKKTKCNVESQNSVDLMQNDQKNVKSVRFSEPLLSVFLIPSRDELQSQPICSDSFETENCRISSDLNVKKCNKTSNSSIQQDQPNNLSKKADKTSVPKILKTDNKSTISPKTSPKISKPKLMKVVLDGVTYVNGISLYNRCLPRRQHYTYDAQKIIPHEWREGVFDKFPGANVEALGYGVL